MKVDPAPRRLEAESVPPIAVVSASESASPSPVPSMPVRSAPSRSNGRKSRSSCSGSMPGPSSATSMCSRSSALGDHADAQGAALASVLHGVADEVQQNLPEPAPIQQRHDVIGGLDVAPDPALVGQRLDQIHDPAHHFQHAHRADVEIDPAGAHACQIQHVVQQRLHVPARRENALDAVALILLELLELQQLGEAEDGVQRGAQFMPEAGDELVAVGEFALGMLAAPGLGQRAEDGVNSRSAVPFGGSLIRLSTAMVAGEDLAVAGRVDELHPAAPVALLRDGRGHGAGQTLSQPRGHPRHEFAPRRSDRQPVTEQLRRHRDWRRSNVPVASKRSAMSPSKSNRSPRHGLNIQRGRRFEELIDLRAHERDVVVAQRVTARKQNAVLHHRIGVGQTAFGLAERDALHHRLAGRITRPDGAGVDAPHRQARLQICA